MEITDNKKVKRNRDLNEIQNYRLKLNQTKKEYKTQKSSDRQKQKVKRDAKIDRKRKDELSVFNFVTRLGTDRLTNR